MPEAGSGEAGGEEMWDGAPGTRTKAGLERVPGLYSGLSTFKIDSGLSGRETPRDGDESNEEPSRARVGGGDAGEGERDPEAHVWYDEAGDPRVCTGRCAALDSCLWGVGAARTTDVVGANLPGAVFLSTRIVVHRVLWLDGGFATCNLEGSDSRRSGVLTCFKAIFCIDFSTAGISCVGGLVLVGMFAVPWRKVLALLSL